MTAQPPLRVLGVATLVSPDGAYGGPTRVALNQCAALTQAGHTTALAAGVRGYRDRPDTISGVGTHLFPVRNLLPRIGFAGMAAPEMVPWFIRHRHDFDVTHIHLARDLVTLPIARLSIALGIPTVIQPHGMIDPSTRALARPIDLVLTRPCLRRASRVMFLTDRERDDLSAVAGQSIHLQHLRNGVPSVSDPVTGSDPVTAQLHPTLDRIPDVLFLARLHPRKRPALFVDAAVELLRSGIRATFSIVGPDEGEGEKVKQLIASSGYRAEIRYEDALDPDSTRERMLRSDIYVLPSIDEPFPMSVLEAMSASLPVVITDSCGLAPLVTRTGSGVVIDNTLEQLTAAIAALVNDSGLRNTLGKNAFATASEELSMSAVTTALTETYRTAIAAATP